MTAVAVPETDRGEAAMASRLRSVAGVLLPDAARPAAPDDQRPVDPVAESVELVGALVTAVAQEPTDERVWLFLCALGAAYPRRPDVDRLRRDLELLPHRSAMIAALEIGARIADEAGDPEAEMEIVVGQVVVDVDHSAKHDLHTGIQRVVRCLLPEWRPRSVVPAAWNRAAGTLRRLGEVEQARIFQWGGQRGADRDPDGPRRLLVPWHCVVVLAEVPPTEVCDRIGALGDDSGNRVVGILYDAIPVVSADMVPSPDSSKFVRFLTCAKFAHRFAGISRSATAEMSGFVRALRTQGLSGPAVTEVGLAMPRQPPGDEPAGPGSDRPVVLVVGSHEPRKNHLAVLYAAETLWREGHDFELEFIGGSGWGDRFPRRAAELQAKGRPLRIRRAVSDTDLDRAYQGAAFTVFPSLHEGFGLPVAESLAHGTPAITSDFGSTAEIGEGGGALLIDPRDDDALIGAMRTLLTDPAVRRTLEAEIAARPERTWSQYAEELWSAIVEPELDHLGGLA